MFYSGNENYMQDLNFYNQTPPSTYNPMMNGMINCNMQNPNMMNNPMCMNQNPGMYGASNQITNLYPSIYRIITPVVSRVVQNSNYQFLNEDTLNNMAETVFNIVDGQIDYNDEQVSINDTSSNSMQNVSSGTNASGNSNTQNNMRASSATTATSSEQSVSASTMVLRRNFRNDGILRDLIRILLIKEILSRRNNSNFMQNQFYSQMPQNTINY